MQSGLTIPISLAQVDAANELHKRLLQWQIADRALDELHRRFPAFDIEATLLKVVAVNQLYGTNVYAISKMARHIENVMREKAQMDDIALVEQLASLPKRKHTSFASKFAHFFIDKERFPIYDSFAEDMVKFHLGRQSWKTDKEHPYRAFMQNLIQLKEQVCLQGSCTFKSLDRYLWLAGLYKSYKTKKNPKINREVEKLFQSLLTNEAPTSLLQEMLPSEFVSLAKVTRDIKSKMT